MTIIKTILTRPVAAVVAVILIIAAFMPIIIFKSAKADLMTSRKITMSSSAAAATSVIYTLQFTTAQSGASSNVGGLVIDFCDNSPIIGQSCTDLNSARAFNTNKAALVLGTQVGITGFSVDTTNSTATKLVLTRTASSIATGTAVTIPLGNGVSSSTSITNPNVGNHTFYARVLTYTTGAGAQGYSSASPGSYVDGGGVALSTSNQLLITAKVQERITFCIYTGGSCSADTSSPGQSTIALGDTNGVLDPSGPYVDISSKFDITTNALSGATVVMKGDVLTTGSYTIASSSVSGMGASAATAYASSAGNEQFGMCLWKSSDTSGTLTLSNATYNNASCNTTSQTSGTGSTGGAGSANFGFNRTNLTSSSGDTIATKTAGGTSTATMAFIGNISNVTEAGIYQTTLTFIATGTY